jgi:hypothetical protein
LERRDQPTRGRSRSTDRRGKYKSSNGKVLVESAEQSGYPSRGGAKMQRVQPPESKTEQRNTIKSKRSGQEMKLKVRSRE